MRLRRLSLLPLLCLAAACSNRAESTSSSPPTPTTPNLAPESAAIHGDIVARLRAIPAFAARFVPGVKLIEGASGLHVATGVASTTGGFVAAGPKLDASLPTHANGAMHLAVEDANGLWIDVVPADLDDVAAEVHEGAAVFASAARDLDVVQVVDPAGGAEELRVAHTLAAAHARWTLTLGPAIAGARVARNAIEVYDASGTTRIRAESPYAIDANGVRRDATIALDGRTLELAIDTTGLAAPIAIDPAWTAAGTLGSGRGFMGSVVLKDGRVLVAGGIDNTGGPTKLADLYDPATSTWTSVASMGTPRKEFVLSLLPSGKVLATGGDSGSGSTTSAEAFDPTTKLWTALAPMPISLRHHTATLTANNTVVVAGGQSDGSGVFGGFVIYTESTNTWATSTLQMPDTRREHTATLLPDGRIFIFGGDNESGAGGSERILDTGVLYTPFPTATLVATPIPPLNGNRATHVAVSLGAGKVLIAGGASPALGGGGNGTPSSGCLEFDAIANAWTPVPPMSVARIGHGGWLLPNGSVLVAGGSSDSSGTVATALSSAEVFVPSKNAWLPASPMAALRVFPGFATLNNGDALVVSGISSLDVTSGALVTATSAERFKVQKQGTACTGNGDCATAACVAGICCASATCGTFACTTGVCLTTCTTTADCATGNFCSAGACVAQKDAGATCTSSDQCKALGSPAASNCVDGICCSSACTDQCAACDVVGYLGQCIAVKGAVHGTRAACATDSTNACASKVCDGSLTTQCVGTPGAETSCRAKSCTGGVATNPAVCDGSGNCPAANTTPCGSYACDGTTQSCRSTCTTASDCATGFGCQSGACVPQSSKCNGDSTASISSDGTTTSCGFYLCRDGVCLTSCSSSSDCSNGSACDTNAAHCVAGSGGTGSSGGCAIGEEADARTPGFLAAFLLSLGVIVRRRAKR